MVKRKIIRKPNRLLTVDSPRYYSWGGDFKTALGSNNMFNFKNTFSGANVANMLKGGVASGLGSAVGNIGGNLIGGGLESGAGSAISSIGSTIGGAVSAVNPLLGGIISAGTGLISGLTNKMFGSKLNKENIAEVENTNKAMNTLMVDSSNADSIEDQWASQNFGENFSQSDIGKDGWFSNKAKDKYKELKKQQEIARNRALTAFDNAADAANNNIDLNALANFSAYGGPINMEYTGVMSPFGNRFDDGGLIEYEIWRNSLPDNLKNTNPNEYNLEEAYKAGLIPEWNDKDKSYHLPTRNPKTGEILKKPTHPTFLIGLMEDAKLGYYPYMKDGKTYTDTWEANKKALGGDLTNGVIKVDNGGTHEENPYEGVQMGVDNQGIPNLVEEGEVIWNNYVFSNRLAPTKEMKKQYRYRGKTFAEVAKNLQKESEERPNDPISKRGLLSSMSKLQQAQEQVKSESNTNKYSKGGKLFATGGPAGINPDLYDNSDDLLINPTGSKIVGTPFATEYQGYNINSNIDDDTDTSDYTPSRQRGGLSLLRYAPAIGAGIGVMSDIFGWTNKPDYSNADLVGSSLDNLTRVSAKPIGNYLTYKPLDRNYYLNKLNSQSAATRRAIVEQSGGNRASAMAGILAADYNALNSLGDLARKAEEYNQAQRERVESFNRGTNQFNSEMALKAAIANKENDKIRLQARTTQAQLRDQSGARASAGRAANLTNLFDSLGEIGREEFSRNMIQSNPALYYSIDGNGNVTYKNGYKDLSESDKRVVREAANKDKKRRKSKGGYLTIRGGR